MTAIDDRSSQQSDDATAPDFYVGPNGKALPSQYKDWIGTNIQKELLAQAENPQLKNAIMQLYRGESFIGNGGTADVIRFDQQTGLMLGKNGGSHVQKGMNLARYRIKELEYIRKRNPENFTKEMKKELQECRGRLHNYQRSQEMANTLNGAGIADTIENNRMIVETLFDAAKGVTKGNTEIISYIEGVKGKVQVVSRWKILPDGTSYLATVILKPVK